MGCDWVMRVLFRITYKDGTEESDYDTSNEGTRGIYLSYGEDDSEADVQMKQWKDICPDTVLYENGKWNSESPDLVYATPEWCGISIRYTRERIIELLDCDMGNVKTIEACPHPERGY